MNTKEKTFISAVVYAHNSAEDIIEFLKALHSLLEEKFESYEIILVNDASTDNTTHLLNEQKALFGGKLTVINTAWKHGHELAMLAGTDLAIGDFILEIESTHLEYPISLLWNVYLKCCSGYDIVFASPKTKLNLTSILFYKLLNRFSYQQLDLKTDSFKIITRRALNAALRSKEKNRYRKILYRGSGFPSKTLFFHPLQSIQSSRTLTEKISFASESLLSFSNIGLKFTLWLSILFFLGSLIIGIYAISIYLTEKTVALGWTTIMLFLSFSFSGIFLILTILGKYLTMILEESKGKPAYTIQSVKRLK